jgi:putative transposase
VVQYGAFQYRELKRHEIVNGTRFLTCSCVHRLPFFKNQQIKTLFRHSLARACLRHNVRLIAWVLMPEHFHLLLVPDLPASPVPKVLYAIKAPPSRKVLARWRALNAPILKRITDAVGEPHFWQPGGGYDRDIYSTEELQEKVNYIHQNPVRRGLVKEATDWEWSSARWHSGQRDGAVPIWDCHLW